VWEFSALVIREVSLYIAWQIAGGFSFAGKGLSPSAHCASPTGKLCTFVKFELSWRGYHSTVSHQPVLIASYLMLTRLAESGADVEQSSCHVPQKVVFLKNFEGDLRAQCPSIRGR